MRTTFTQKARTDLVSYKGLVLLKTSEFTGEFIYFFISQDRRVNAEAEDWSFQVKGMTSRGQYWASCVTLSTQACHHLCTHLAVPPAQRYGTPSMWLAGRDLACSADSVIQSSATLHWLSERSCADQPPCIQEEDEGWMESTDFIRVLGLIMEDSHSDLKCW